MNEPSFFPPSVFTQSPLFVQRLVHSGPGKSSPLLDSELSFGLRSGTKQGVETHVFRVDSAKELSTWTHLLVEGSHNAAELIKEVTTGTDNFHFSACDYGTISSAYMWKIQGVFFRAVGGAKGLDRNNV